MSFQTSRYICSACDYTSEVLSLYAQRTYVTPTSKAGVISKIGWCHDCETMKPIEALPTEQELAVLLHTKEARQLQLGRLIETEKLQRPFLARVLNLNTRPSDQRYDLEFEVQSLQWQIDRAQAVLGLMTHHRSPPRCLACASTQIEYLLLIKSIESHLSDDAEALPIGFRHPGCGGEMLIRRSDIRWMMKKSTLLYDTEGILLDIVDGEDEAEIEDLADILNSGRL
ncbi:hypothetical protein [Chitinilyticum piscinae]|uniref:CpXC domain-containing protein n=1 Tax=Chitinilyticum piscinae TaxID=2866724 RepID=A0A8J7G405_9NEIS|nr:hypothetical protein [Chitinilyticum piscinae]MBE9611033.1 hypothetical protein [Chitinilyticum piscinae]